MCPPRASRPPTEGCRPRPFRPLCSLGRPYGAVPTVSRVAWQGYSIGSASLACFLLFGAFMDEFTQFSGRPFKEVDIAVPEVLIGGLLGVRGFGAVAGFAVCYPVRRPGEAGMRWTWELDCGGGVGRRVSGLVGAWARGVVRSGEAGFCMMFRFPPCLHVRARVYLLCCGHLSTL